MAYLESTKIRMYPTALRGNTPEEVAKGPFDPAARLGTEFNLTNAVNRLTIDGSFVISRQAGTELEFSMMGYYFRVSDVSALKEKFNNATKIYAKIKLDETQGTSAYKLRTLVSADKDFSSLDKLDGKVYYFNGVEFTSSAMSQAQGTDGVYQLLILTRPSTSSDNWQVPEASLLRFDSRDVNIGLSKEGGKALHDVVAYTGGDVVVNADEFTGHLTGNVTGDLDGNAKTATDSDYAEKIGTSKSHPAIGDVDKPVYVDSNGIIRYCNVTKGSNDISGIQMIKFANGQVQDGAKITYSTAAPTSSDKGNPGDIWIQYRKGN